MANSILCTRFAKLDWRIGWCIGFMSIVSSKTAIRHLKKSLEDDFERQWSDGQREGEEDAAHENMNKMGSERLNPALFPDCKIAWLLGWWEGYTKEHNNTKCLRTTGKAKGGHGSPCGRSHAGEWLQTTDQKGLRVRRSVPYRSAIGLTIAGSMAEVVVLHPSVQMTALDALARPDYQSKTRSVVAATRRSRSASIGSRTEDYRLGDAASRIDAGSVLGTRWLDTVAIRAVSPIRRKLETPTCRGCPESRAVETKPRPLRRDSESHLLRFHRDATQTICEE